MTSLTATGKPLVRKLVLEPELVKRRSHRILVVLVVALIATEPELVPEPVHRPELALESDHYCLIEIHQQPEIAIGKLPVRKLELEPEPVQMHLSQILVVLAVASIAIEPELEPELESKPGFGPEAGCCWVAIHQLALEPELGRLLEPAVVLMTEKMLVLEPELGRKRLRRILVVLAAALIAAEPEPELVRLPGPGFEPGSDLSQE
jgi:hypothetical protein